MSPKFLGCENSRKMKPFTKGVSVGGTKHRKRSLLVGKLEFRFGHGEISVPLKTSKWR